ncbi:hypothetical protein L218DRAFT_471351 [Marasmius fiardii PR-910]|nr:hypothetical protein L218DRAFT_471351 [Marasmius fiardii PR-910]
MWRTMSDASAPKVLEIIELLSHQRIIAPLHGRDSTINPETLSSFGPVHTEVAKQETSTTDFLVNITKVTHYLTSFSSTS